MLSFFKGYKVFAIVLTILSIIIVTLIYSTLNRYEPLPIYQPEMINMELVDSTIQHKKKYHNIADFSLTNQNGETVTQSNFKDKIYVADFFFTTCQSICPVMTSNMVDIQKEIINDSDILLLSHTVTPEIDSVEQLKRYAISKGVIDKKWHLVTGDKKQIYHLARKSYLAVKNNGDGGPYDMIHTENFVLVDKKKQIRGIYDGTSTKEIKRLINDINHLKEQYK